MRPKVGDIITFRDGSCEIFKTGRVTWVGACGIDVQVGKTTGAMASVVTIDEEDIVPTPIPVEGS